MRHRRRGSSPYRRRAALHDSQAADTSQRPQSDELIGVHAVPTGGDLLALDHVSLSVGDPSAMAAFLCDHVGMHELARTPGVAVVGAGDGAARLALVAAEGPREPGALARLVLRVADVERAVAALPSGTRVEGDQLERATFEGPEGLGLGFTLVAGGGIDYDLDHVVLRVSDPEQTALALAEVGFVPRDLSLHVADKHIALTSSPGSTAHALLDHIAVRVDSLDAVAALARQRGLETDGRVADDTFAIVLPGPEQIRLRVVEQTPL
ncbi:MAG: VOC family protein, partial [Actinomycetota bacterium]|nr:VOC family protein [Actinomycetota bacterium]